MVRLAIFAAAFALLAGASPPARSWTVTDTWTYPVGGTACGFQCPEEVVVLDVENGGALTAEVAVAFTCESTIVGISLDGADPVISAPVPAGGTTGVIDFGAVTAGTGTCRRVQLDLGERNPDGTRFYRTADFQFTR